MKGEQVKKTEETAVVLGGDRPTSFMAFSVQDEKVYVFPLVPPPPASF